MAQEKVKNEDLISSNPSDKEDTRSGMSRRFDGDRGRELLVGAISQSALFTSVPAVGDLTKNGELIDVKPGDTIITQGGEDNDIYLIVSGRFNIVINGRPVAAREPVTHVGEMALIDVTAKRCASVVATEPSVVLRVTEDEFSKFADKNPIVWRRIAIELSKRLKERSAFIKEPRSEPVVFIACSSEGLTIAREIQNLFHHDHFVVQIWTDNVFQPSRTPIEDLLEQCKKIDFGIVVFSPDDSVLSRDLNSLAPRDNVIFELGLIMGAIGRDRSFIVAQSGLDLKVPSDLLGVNQLSYNGTPENLAARLGPVCNQIRKVITERKSI